MITHEFVAKWLILGVVFLIMVVGAITTVALLMMLGNWALDVIVRHTKVYAVWLEFAEFYRNKHKRQNMK